MQTGACPIPRPLLVHEPRVAQGFPWGQAAYPGHLPLAHATCSHFAQVRAAQLPCSDCMILCQPYKDACLLLDVRSE